MQVAKSKATLLLCLAAVVILSGCTDWKKKYESLNVENQNAKGLLEREKAEKGQLSEQVAKDQETIQSLQKQATGFGAGYDVNFDAAAGTVTVTLPDAILFDAGKAELKGATSKELNHIGSVLKEKYAGRAIEVAGHTDTDPIKKSKWTDNLELSSQRAMTVARYLIHNGIPENKVKAVGCGSTKPVASNSTTAGKQKNRRVEIIVHMTK
jgi:chemotaxis protein MotB